MSVKNMVHTVCSILKSILLILIAAPAMLFCCIPMVLTKVLRLFIKNRYLNGKVLDVGEYFASLWTKIVEVGIRYLSNTYVDIVVDGELPSSGSALIVSNHTSWFDIPAIFHISNMQNMVIRFFIKRQLLFSPLIGQAAWSMDCPLVRRYSSEYLKKYPHKRGLDFETTKKSCESFKGRRIYILNYLEGTRKNDAKYKKQNPDYTNLLNPRAGGAAQVLEALAGQIDHIINVTLVYDPKPPSFIDVFLGRPHKCTVYIETLPVPSIDGQGYFVDDEYKKSFQAWINSLWREKDGLISRHHSQD